MAKFTVPNADQEALIRAEGIDPVGKMVQWAGEDKLILRNMKTSTDIALYFPQRLKS